MSTETQLPTNKPAARVAKRGGIAALALFAGCAIACSLPVLIGIGAVSSIGAFLGGWQIAGIALIVAAAGAGTWWFVRRSRIAARRAATAATTGDASSCDSSCGCGGC